MEYKMTRMQWELFLLAREVDEMPGFWRTLGRAVGFDPKTAKHQPLRPMEFYTAIPEPTK